jgi:UDP-GlcNAc3NAcA epimerase
MTDSGGLQKEAYFMGKPCITLRDETEWVELVDARVNRLVGANKSNIVQTFNSIEPLNPETTSMLYGDGNASEKIVSGLLSFG